MAKPNVISRQELLQSARDVIASHGIQALTLKAVATGAGVTQGTVYYHFRNKEQLLLELIKEMCQDSWKNLLDDAGQGEEILEKALASARSRCTHDSPYHRVYFSLIAAGIYQETLGKELASLQELENKALGMAVKRFAKNEELVDIPAERWATLFNAWIDGLALQALLSPSFDADQAYADLAQVIRYLVGRKGEEQT
ncbi:TetR/AcrR family transcriptional regulator [Brevibacillus borstelensis]|uniref:TetR/AcrR family transcriptional regulator n=1 Tax=Brevibacillus borstelensis TaxID=45462 RepID=UPI0030C526A4